MGQWANEAVGRIASLSHCLIALPHCLILGARPSAYQ